MEAPAKDWGMGGEGFWDTVSLYHLRSLIHNAAAIAPGRHSGWASFLSSRRVQLYIVMQVQWHLYRFIQDPQLIRPQVYAYKVEDRGSELGKESEANQKSFPKTF